MNTYENAAGAEADRAQQRARPGKKPPDPTLLRLLGCQP